MGDRFLKQIAIAEIAKLQAANKELHSSLETYKARVQVLENAAKAVLVWWDAIDTDQEDPIMMRMTMDLLRAAARQEDSRNGS